MARVVIRMGYFRIVEPEYLEKVRKEIQKYGFFAEIDKSRTDPELLMACDGNQHISFVL